VRRMPADSPGMAASQNNSVADSRKPMLGRRTTRALTMNQTMNAIIRFRVVMVRVRQASFLPVDSQNAGSSGVQVRNHVRGLGSLMKGLQSRKWGIGDSLPPCGGGLGWGVNFLNTAHSASLREYHRQVIHPQLR
jgi:hypothetical protein